ncbi:hypothetical protein VKT23_020566 [Stygiomarasmius scandens]|uniref:Uncharacterized protein n=1 Tax=Marasmiellus scandens TaxID=2682957 RepID=A0ABR1ILI4_9AGAR
MEVNPIEVGEDELYYTANASLEWKEMLEEVVWVIDSLAASESPSQPPSKKPRSSTTFKPAPKSASISKPRSSQRLK